MMRALVLLLLAGCGVDATQSHTATGTDAAIPPHLAPTSEAVEGAACAYGAEQWLSDSNVLLAARFEDVAPLIVGEQRFETLAEINGALAPGVNDDFTREQITLALNLALNDAGVFGTLANLGGATLTTGEYAGKTAREVSDVARRGGHGSSLGGALHDFNLGFGGCRADDYLDCGRGDDEGCDGSDDGTDDSGGGSGGGVIDGSGNDVDGDGVSSDNDCDDADASIGALLYEDDLSSDAGYFAPTAQLDKPWLWQDDAATATEGGQNAQLGAGSWDNYVVYADLSATESVPGCGVDCDEVCGEYAPDGGCYTDYQAIGLGLLTVSISGTGQMTLSNASPDYDICLEGLGMWTHAGSQGLAIGEAESASSSYRIPASGDLKIYYGSWTTNNGTYAPYLGQQDFWCFQEGTTLTPGLVYDTFGAQLPASLAQFITEETDLDADGVEDHVDWARATGVQAQVNIWNYQNGHAVVAVGKLAQSLPGAVEVTLTSQNRGASRTTAYLQDTVPPTWTPGNFSRAPDSMTRNADGSLTLQWGAQLFGCSEGCSVYDEDVITYALTSNLGMDRDIVELPAATLRYDEGDGTIATSTSMKAAAFDFDADADGALVCGHTDRWRAGVLARASLDADQGEGFHGYRCALASNNENECFPEGYFLQIGEFMDAPEDDVASECEGTCANPSFDQLSRVMDGGFDLLGDAASLEFRVVGDTLTCAAYDTDGGLLASTSATDDSFASGATGFSTLNALGSYHHIRVCEAF